MDLYSRQEELNLNIPNKVCIVGIGGIGNHIGLNLAQIGVKTLYLIDYDSIESHNLNRTMFRLMDIDTPKSDAITDLILERREDIEINVFEKRIQELNKRELMELKDCLIIDCRDNIQLLPDELNNNPLIKLGYDGLNVTIIINPDYKKVWSLNEETGYRIVPSFIVPPLFLSSIIIGLITNPNFDITKHNHNSVTLNLNELINNLIPENKKYLTEKLTSFIGGD